MMPDYELGETLDFKFTTRAFATGIPTTLAGTPAIVIYEDNSTTEITAAETLTVDFDGVTGLNNLRVVATSGNGFGAGQSYSAVISAGTVGGVSVVGEVVAQFSIERDPAFNRLGAPAGASIAADLLTIDNLVDDLESRLTAARAGYLDNLNGHTAQSGDSYARLGAPAGASIAADLVTIDNLVDDLETRLTAVRAGYLDNLNGHTAQTGDSFARLGAPAGASIAADLVVIDNFVDELETRLTAIRAGYLDNLNGHTAQTGDSFARLGAPAGASVSADIAGVQTVADAIQVITDALTSAGAAKLALSMAGVINGSTTGTPTTSSANTDLTGFADDELIGRSIVFTGGTANGQAGKITDYTNTNGVVAYTDFNDNPLTTAPAASDTFIIV